MEGMLCSSGMRRHEAGRGCRRAAGLGEEDTSPAQRSRPVSGLSCLARAQPDFWGPEAAACVGGCW